VLGERRAQRGALDIGHHERPDRTVALPEAEARRLVGMDESKRDIERQTARPALLFKKGSRFPTRASPFGL